MKVFIVGYIMQLTDAWHPEGGLVVVARDLDHAKELIAIESKAIRPTDEEWASAVVYDIQGEGKPDVFVFPNAGCC